MGFPSGGGLLWGLIGGVVLWALVEVWREHRARKANPYWRAER